MASDDLIFEEELQRRFGHKLGALTVVGGRKAFPLGLTLSRAFVAHALRWPAMLRTAFTRFRARD